MVRLSVVIPTLGRAAVLGRGLDRLAEQTVGPAAFEVVIAADAAERDVAAVERVAAGRPFAVRIVQADTPGASAARNRGWRAATGAVVLFLGDDMLPAADLIARHAEGHERHPEPEAGVLGHVRWARELGHSVFMDWLDAGVQYDFGAIRGDRAAWWHLYSSNVSLKRERLELVGGFDEEFRIMYEDLDLGLRLDQVGLRLVYDAGAVTEHLHEPTLEGWRDRMRLVARAERQFVAKHPAAEPYFLNRFREAAAAPPARRRGVRLARFVPRGLPLVGPRVWFSADRWFTQQLAPAFLDAWSDGD